MAKKIPQGIIKGHFWHDDGGLTIGWTGCDGLLTCQRCMAQAHYEQDHSRAPRKILQMHDIFGKRIKKKDWEICKADKGGRHSSKQ